MDGSSRKSIFRSTVHDVVTLLERSSQFGYDSFGSKKQLNLGLPHMCDNYRRQRVPADSVQRRDAWYQSCHGAGVKYNPTSPKNPTSIFSTLPASRLHRKPQKSTSPHNSTINDCVQDSILAGLDSQHTLDLTRQQFSSKPVFERKKVCSNSLMVGESPS